MDEQVEKDNKKGSRSIFFSSVDRSDIIAIIALLVSLAGALIGIRETNILREQQEMAMEQKTASVLPYLSSNFSISSSDDSTIQITLQLQNEGIGPAMLADFIIRYDSTATSASELPAVLNEKHPGLVAYPLQINANTEGFIPAGRSIQLFDITIKVIDGTLMEKLLQIAERFSTEVCYCDVYGKCWKSSDNSSWPLPTKECSAPAQF